MNGRKIIHGDDLEFSGESTGIPDKAAEPKLELQMTLERALCEIFENRSAWIQDYMKSINAANAKPTTVAIGDLYRQAFRETLEKRFPGIELVMDGFASTLDVKKAAYKEVKRWSGVYMERDHQVRLAELDYDKNTCLFSHPQAMETCHQAISKIAAALGRQMLITFDYSVVKDPSKVEDLGTGNKK